MELGHATDTTLARVSAGVVSIEGVNVVTISSTDTLSNKTLTTPKFADLGYIADANGNEIIILDTTTTAVNEFTVVNAATGELLLYKPQEEIQTLELPSLLKEQEL